MSYDLLGLKDRVCRPDVVDSTSPLSLHGFSLLCFPAQWKTPMHPEDFLKTRVAVCLRTVLDATMMCTRRQLPITSKLLIFDRFAIVSFPGALLHPLLYLRVFCPPPTSILSVLTLDEDRALTSRFQRALSRGD